MANKRYNINTTSLGHQVLIVLLIHNLNTNENKTEKLNHISNNETLFHKMT